jgi:hypothetical protein
VYDVPGRPAQATDAIPRVNPAGGLGGLFKAPAAGGGRGFSGFAQFAGPSGGFGFRKPSDPEPHSAVPGCSLPSAIAVSGPAVHENQQRLTGQQIGMKTVKAAKDQAQPAVVPRAKAKVIKGPNKHLAPRNATREQGVSPKSRQSQRPIRRSPRLRERASTMESQ